MDIAEDQVLYSTRVDVKEWIANGRFEGDLQLFCEDGRHLGDSLELRVRFVKSRVRRESCESSYSGVSGRSSQESVRRDIQGAFLLFMARDYPLFLYFSVCT